MLLLEIALWKARAPMVKISLWKYEVVLINMIVPTLLYIVTNRNINIEKISILSPREDHGLKTTKTESTLSDRLNRSDKYIHANSNT